MATQSLIFITGGTGFIGSHVVHDTLKAGHRARLTVRKVAQIDELKSRFTLYASQLEFVVISDITDTAALRAGLSDDVQYIFHLASPMPGKGDDFKTEYLQPAVKGTEAILEAAAAAPSVKKTVIISSLLALIPLGALQTPGLHIQEGDNTSITVNPDMPFPSGPAGNGPKYSASKILAHRATVEWMSKHKPHFSLVTVHPTFVLGYDYTQKDASSPSGINAYLLQSLTAPPGGKPIIPGSFVDVRDVSLVMLRSLGLEGGDWGKPLTEVLVAGRATTWQEVVDIVRERYPSVEVALQGPFAAPFTADTSRAERQLGVAWRSTQELISSVFDQQMELRARAGRAGL
ncbi:hypothetical protein B0H67DRAFT_647281 [Lasiosphaeris hirsuta]|uniref:NAD-dependent epimerase/dehydratase domain-containing protein n=1 Tax=Lasiosphaeris hirsuta TaxID=260670 RepID=A0AA40DSR2_9PEZI|nr:hypothetical protein B0H67DRAFT_647281 [Lasiosphaeris hirsuta]